MNFSFLKYCSDAVSTVQLLVLMTLPKVPNNYICFKLSITVSPQYTSVAMTIIIFSQHLFDLPWENVGGEVYCSVSLRAHCVLAEHSRLLCHSLCRKKNALTCEITIFRTDNRTGNSTCYFPVYTLMKHLCFMWERNLNWVTFTNHSKHQRVPIALSDAKEQARASLSHDLGWEHNQQRCSVCVHHFELT